MKKIYDKVSNRNTSKRFLLISKIILKTSKRSHLTTRYLPEVPVQNHQFLLEYIPICNQVQRPVISIIVDPYMSFYEKWGIITEIFDSWKIENISIFHFWGNSPKNGQISQLFTLYSKGRHFGITKLDILIFCNILHLETDFWNLS